MLEDFLSLYKIDCFNVSGVIFHDESRANSLVPTTVEMTLLTREFITFCIFCDCCRHNTLWVFRICNWSYSNSLGLGLGKILT